MFQIKNMTFAAVFLITYYDKNRSGTRNSNIKNVTALLKKLNCSVLSIFRNYRRKEYNIAFITLKFMNCISDETIILYKTAKCGILMNYFIDAICLFTKGRYYSYTSFKFFFYNKLPY